MDSQTTVRLDAVRKTYGSGAAEVTALDGVSAGFAPGSFTAIMGPSGSGKSTLLHCAAGLDRVTTGRVTIDGVDITDLSDHELTLLRRDRVGFVFQAFNLVGALTAAQNVELPLRLARRRPSGDQIRAALAEVGLADRSGHRPAELSGGQQQRVAIARALISRPAVLFADEPTGALDTTSSRAVLELLRGVVDRHGQTVIMVTHDPVAASRADRVMLLADGRLADELVGADATTIAARTALAESGVRA